MSPEGLFQLESTTKGYAPAHKAPHVAHDGIEAIADIPSARPKNKTSLLYSETYTALNEHEERAAFIYNKLAAKIGQKYTDAFQASKFANSTTLHNHLTNSGLVEMAQICQAAEKAEPNFIQGASLFQQWLESNPGMTKMSRHMLDVAKDAMGSIDTITALIARRDAGENVWIFDYFDDEDTQFLEDIAKQPEYWRAMFGLGALCHDMMKAHTANHFFDHMVRHEESIAQWTLVFENEPKESEAYKQAQKEFSADTAISVPLTKLFENTHLTEEIMPGSAGPRAAELTPYLNTITKNPTILHEVITEKHPDSVIYKDAILVFWRAYVYDKVDKINAAEKRCIDEHAADGYARMLDILTKGSMDITSLPRGLQIMLNGIGDHHAYMRMQDLFAKILQVKDVFSASTTRDTHMRADGTVANDGRKSPAEGMAEAVNSSGSQLSSPAILLHTAQHRDLVNQLLSYEKQPMKWTFSSFKQNKGREAGRSLNNLAAERAVALELQLASETDRLSNDVRTALTNAIEDSMRAILRDENEGGDNFKRKHEEIRIHIHEAERSIHFETRTSCSQVIDLRMAANSNTQDITQEEPCMPIGAVPAFAS